MKLSEIERHEREIEAQERQRLEGVFQIMPVADGWRVGWAMKGEVETEPVVCWALIYSERLGGKTVAGCLRNGKTIDTEDPALCTNFLGYLAPGETVPDRWKAEAERQVKAFDAQMQAAKLEERVAWLKLNRKAPEAAIVDFVQQRIAAGTSSEDLSAVMRAYQENLKKRAS
jgi:hypothetical protein